ncbi:MAG: hypothetical protein EPN91_05205 [Salinibacterium sp.]|nr:MAG: hypothetical protein EPN91_05205 [Salinibacterium sp.]
MKLYSDFGPRRTRQIAADLFALLAISGWVWLGITVYQLVENLAAFGVQMEQAGSGFKKTMTDVGDALGGVPLIGGGIRVPFDQASDAGAALEAAGQSQQVAVNQLATGLGIGIAVVPILTILLFWLVPRIRFMRKAGSAKALVESGAGIDLLALRALASQRISALRAVDPDAMAAWRRGDETVMRALAQLELKASGVRLRE